jgi:lipopolysaccharide export system protein LptA
MTESWRYSPVSAACGAVRRLGQAMSTTRHWRAVAVVVIVAASAVCAPDASGQKNQGPPNALQGFSQNRDEPVKIRAASLELREKDKMATFSGDVYVLQGDTEMRCKQLVVSYEEETDTRTAKAADPGPGGERQIRRIEAKGNVIVVQKDQNATGDAATFNMRENTVTLVGNVVVTRGRGCLARSAADGRSHQRRIEDGWGPGRRHISGGAEKPS